MGKRLSVCLVLLATTLSICAVEPYGLEARPEVAPFLDGVLPEAAPVVTDNWTVVPAFPNLLFTNLLGVLPVPGTGLLCAWEREGRVWTFENTPDVTEKTLVLDISEQCQGWDDSGLLGLAFHPGFETNGHVYLCYTWVAPGTVMGSPIGRPPEYVVGKYHDRLSRFTITDGVAAPASELVLVDQTGDSVWHNGGGMFFHPDNGFLYWTVGDDARFATQDISRKLFSGVFRIDVDMRGGAVSHPIPRQPEQGTTAHYYIPNDNPFVGEEGVLEEFFCLGLRSPHRMTIDPPTGRIFLGDVGGGAREEIDIIEPGEAGLNFQWKVIEGLNGDLTPPYVGTNRRPVLDYNHSEGAAVIGGYVYRGTEFAAELGGRYIFGDNVSRTIWVMDESTIPATKTVIGTLPKGAGPSAGADYTGLSSFGLDADNELYLCQMSSVGGRIYKLAHADSESANRPLPTLLSETGVFSDLTTLAANPGLLPYNVNSPLWSDSAHKSRWLAVPSNAAVTFAATGEWRFPEGTVFVKHFELSTDDTQPSLRKRLETRLLVCDTNGAVYGASYKWRADNSDAELVNVLTKEDVEITTATGTRLQTWTYPGRRDCLTCHTQPSGGVLGVNTRQLNGDFTYPTTGLTDNQIRALNHIGLFNPPVEEAAIADYAKLVAVTNLTASVEHRVRSYLDANCAHCHRPNGAVHAAFDARFDTPLESQGLIGGVVLDELGLAGVKIVQPGDIAKSMLYQRAADIADIKMPPLAKSIADTDALALLATWINSLPPATDTLPVQWAHGDVGATGLTGSASHTAGQFTVKSGGSDIWEGVDTFHFVYQTLDGDGSIRARVVTLEDTHEWAKAGAMIRESLAADSAHVFTLVTPENGTALQYRAETGGNSTSVAGPAVGVPYWVRLDRSGSYFTSYVSHDGEDWLKVGGVGVTMDSQVKVGLAVTAHNNSLLTTSVFDNVTVTVGGVLPPLQLLEPVQNDGVFQFMLQTEPSLTYVIEASTDLVTWTPILTNTSASSLLQVIDAAASNYPALFYRGREQ